MFSKGTNKIESSEEAELKLVGNLHHMQNNVVASCVYRCLETMTQSGISHCAHLCLNVHKYRQNKDIVNYKSFSIFLC